MKKNRSKILIIACIAISFLLQDCKKGPEDPAFSLRTRKTRLTGKWHLKTGNAGITILDPVLPPLAQGFILDGNYATVTETPTNGPVYIYKFAYFVDLEINKDGSFKLTETYGNNVLIANGKWNFLGGIGELKNKEAVIFIIESVDNDQTTGHLFNKQATEFTYKILGLRNTDIKLESGSKEYISANGKSFSYSATYELVQ